MAINASSNDAHAFSLPGLRSPLFEVPAHACDAHLHILDPRFGGAGIANPVGMCLDDYAAVRTRRPT